MGNYLKRLDVRGAARKCIGILLFLAYVNDIWRNMESTIRLFADDSVIYRKIIKSEDMDELQKALDRLGNERLRMRGHVRCYVAAFGAQLNISKSKVMPIGTWDIMVIPYHTEMKFLGFSITHLYKVCIWRGKRASTGAPKNGKFLFSKYILHDTKNH